VHTSSIVGNDVNFRYNALEMIAYFINADILLG
jgi:hypothetical protein